VTGNEIWQLRPGQSLEYRDWDGEFVLYNDLSGDTHLLDDAAIELLLALKRGPASFAALAEVLGAAFEIGDADLAGETRNLLDHLKHLYLVDTPAC
jgi:PqqD family protein of HPr-rel-A system